jgi:hypothetical protein
MGHNAFLRCLAFIQVNKFSGRNLLKISNKGHSEFMNVILLCSDFQHVSATHVTNFRVVRAKIQIYL